MLLHILWMIVKFILIVIGILLGLLVFALLLLLFCPVRYGGEASGNMEEWKAAQATFFVSWLFRGIVFKLQFTEGKLTYKFRILGISLDKWKNKSFGKWKNGSGKVRDTGASKKQRKSAGSSERMVGSSKETAELPKKNTELPGKTSKLSGKSDGSQEKTPELSKETVVSPENSLVNENTQDLTAPFQQDEKSRTGIRNKISGFMDILKRITGRIRKIPDIFSDLSSKVQSIYDKIDYWKQFLTNPRVKEAFSYVWSRVKRFLKHLFPTKLEGQVVFGAEDPSLTGTVLAVLGITIPLHKNCIAVTPVFTGNNYLEGHLKLRGRVYGIVILLTALQIYFHKNVQYIIHRWKHRKE